MYRRHLSRASYRELLRSGFNPFMHTHDIFEEVELDFEDAEDEEEEQNEAEGEEGKKQEKAQAGGGGGAAARADGQPASPEQAQKAPYDPVLHLLRLMATRVHQEYFEQLNSMHKNVFRAVEKVEDSLADQLAADLTAEEERVLRRNVSRES